MKPLPETFRQDGWDFTVLGREGRYAILHKRKGGVDGWEVVRIALRTEQTFPNGQVCPAHEAMPSSREWGMRGWSFTDRDEAWGRFTSLCHDAQQQYTSPPSGAPEPS